MTADPAGVASADGVRARNRELDAQLRGLVAEVRPDELHVDPANGEWTLAENLAHIAEFPAFFAPQLVAQLRDEDRRVGRTHDHAGRLAAVAAAPQRELWNLRGAIDESLRVLDDTLVELRDEDLGRVAENTKYGPETLATFLDRYVLGHKAAHVRQLRETIDAVRARPE